MGSGSRLRPPSSCPSLQVQSPVRSSGRLSQGVGALRSCPNVQGSSSVQSPQDPNVASSPARYSYTSHVPHRSGGGPPLKSRRRGSPPPSGLPASDTHSEREFGGDNTISSPAFLLSPLEGEWGGSAGAESPGAGWGPRRRWWGGGGAEVGAGEGERRPRHPGASARSDRDTGA